ncbi:MAG: hypothetical protein M3251_01120 [Thermoproteota archaeon]|nr:hypothetical protein [Thermoproteota archaeon]
MEEPKEILVIYRLKFKSKHDFEQAEQTLRFGQNIGKYIESLQKSFALQRPQPSYPLITPPEVNFCRDDLVIYLCSHELRQYTKGSQARHTIMEGMADSMPQAPYYYELFLMGSFGPIADVSIAASKHV